MTGSARQRFVFTVGINLVRTGISFATGMSTARWLGPSAYGNMAFLLGTFAGLRALLDMGSAAAFFTFMSQQPRSWRYVRGFFLWQLAQFVVPCLVIAALFPADWIATIWRGQERSLVLLAFAAAFLQGSVWPVVQQACESQRRTYLAQSIGVAIVAIHFLAIGTVWYFGRLGLPAILAAVAIEYSVAAVVALSRLSFATPAASEPAGAILRRFVQYCIPLVPFSALSFANEFADRWLLQKHGGGIQQAYYAVGAQLAAIALIATASILSIFWKEIAEAHHRGDLARTGALYRRVSRLLFFVGATVAGLLIPWAADVLSFVLGSAYVGGAAALGIMLLYPIHQAMGQIGATMMYATERVKTHVIIGGAVMVFGIAMTYFVLAPRDATVPGLGLASTGLAAKMVGVQIVGVNVLAYTIARINGWSFDWIYQPITLGVCIGIGWLVRVAAVAALPASFPLPVRLGAAGVVYSGLLAAALFAAPSLAGFTRPELMTDLRRLSDGVLRARRA